MATLAFLGATSTVTGSKTLLETNGRRILVDCGLFQGKKSNRLKNWDAFPVPPESIGHILLTHAHIDHSGYLPRFHRYGFAGPVHATHATADLCDILLRDSAHLQEEDARWANRKGFSKHDPALPLYTIEEAEQVLTRFTPSHYGEDFYVDDLRVKFKDAGHILGSSLVDIKRTREHSIRKLLFTGDLGRPQQPILRDPTQVFNVNYLVLESTYGDRLHGEHDSVEQLARVINNSVERGGVLIIPSFAVGRTQMLLYLIRELEDNGEIPTLPIYMDSPMAINATDIFKNHLADCNLTARILTLEGKEIFTPGRLHLCRTRDESIAINKVKKRAIIISASGMITGGRILHHIRERLPHEQNTLLFIGYQAEGTRGRTILEGEDSIKVHGKTVAVRAQVENIFGFSGHADYREIMAWLMAFNQPPEMIFINHGESHASKALAQQIRDQFHWPVTIPGEGQSFEIEL